MTLSADGDTQQSCVQVAFNLRLVQRRAGQRQPRQGRDLLRDAVLREHRRVARIHGPLDPACLKHFTLVGQICASESIVEFPGYMVR